MKKNKQRSIAKAARKSAQKNIVENLIVELKKVSATIGTGSSRLEKVIEKGAIKLAKKMAKEIKLKTDNAEVNQPIETEVSKSANPQKAESITPAEGSNSSKKGNKKNAKESVAVTAS